MTQEQLERSILERKERDELHAIAQAMAIKPASRWRKADIIDQILRATGIDVEGIGVEESSGRATPRHAPRSTSTPAPADSRPAGEVAAEKDRAKPSSRTRHANGSSAIEQVVEQMLAPVATAPETATVTESGQDASAPAGSATAPEADEPASPRPRRSRAVAKKPPQVLSDPAPLPGLEPEPTIALPSVAGAVREESVLAPTSSAFDAPDGGGDNVTDAGPGGRARVASPGHDSSTPRPSRGAGGSTGSARQSATIPAPRPGRSEPSTAARPSPRTSVADDSSSRDSRATREHASASGERSGSALSAPRPTTGREGAGSQPGNQLSGQSLQGGATGNELGNRRGRRRRGREREPGQEIAWQGELVPVKGLLDLREEGYGFLRTSGYLSSPRDVYVSVSQARRLGLRRGDAIEGGCRPAGPSEKYPALLRVDTVAGMNPEEARGRPRFEDLTPLFPDQQLRLEMPGDSANLTARIVDLVSPIGKGQRGMIVSPPKAGKTTIMKQIAHSLEANNPDVHLMVLLVGERPEEVTDMRRSVRGEVIASTFDRPSEEHTAIAELAIERAKRLVELGRDVVIILDGITRLARAYNLAQPATGRIMSGGVDSGALYPPKKLFGAARNVEEGGSLTILATALVETGSKMDEVIFEEFKGTGNLELRLDRRLAERRLYPAIDVNGSSTRHEELLFDRHQLQQVWKLRRVLNALGNEGNAAAGLELLMDKIRTTRSNDEFLAEIAKAPTSTV